MYIISIVIFKYFLDHNVIIIIVVMQSSVDVYHINSNFQVFFRPLCYYRYCFIESNVVANHINRNFQVFFIPQCLIIIGVMTSKVDVNQININFQVFFRPLCYYRYWGYAIQCKYITDQ